MKRTAETSEQYWERVEREIARDDAIVPRCFTYGWWVRYRKVDLTDEGFMA